MRRTALQPRRSHKQHAVNQFARQLADRVTTAANNHDGGGVILVAAPRFLAELRGHLPKSTLQRVVRELPRDLVGLSAPALQRRWWAARGLGAHCTVGNGAPRQIRTSKTNELKRASASITVSESWHAAGKTAQLDRLQRSVARLRNYGDFWQHMLVAEGAVDFAIDAIGLGPYDIAAIAAVVAESGGAWSDRHGAPNWRNDSLVTSNGALHSDVLAELNAAP